MTIEPMRSDKGQSRANCICDTCCREEVIPCNHERRRGMPDAVNQGQAIKKLTKSGWSFIKGKLRCPMCEAKRKAYETEKSKHVPRAGWENGIPEGWHNIRGSSDMNKPATAASVSDIRQPTPKQKRLIILALEDAYDDKASRYRGVTTDKSLAAEIGDGIMPGWIAEQREALFGPSGGNEEMETIRAEIVALNAQFAEKVKALNSRIDAVCKAVGPKAARA